MTAVVGAGFALGLLLVGRHFGLYRSAGFLSGVLVLSAHANAVQSFGVGVATRFLGLAVLIVLATGNKSLRDDEGTVPGLRWVLGSSALVHVLVWFMSPGGSPVVVLGGVLMFVFAINRLEASDHSVELMKGVWGALVVTIIVSVLMFFASVPDAVAGGRLRGLYANANTMGFFAALLVLVCVLRQVRWRAGGPLIVIGMLALLLSGSRSALLALVVGLVVYVVSNVWRGHVKAGIGIVVAVLGGFLVLRRLALFDADLVFRGNNSRESGSEYALYAADWTWFTGVGYQQSSVEVASTPLRWLAEGGLFCALVVVLAYVVVLATAVGRGAPSIAIALFGITSSLFEGWYVAATSGLFIIYWICALLVIRGNGGALHRGGSDAAAHSGIQQIGR